MKKLNKKDTLDIFEILIILCVGAIFISILPYLVFGLLVIWLVALIFGDDDNKGDDDE